MLIQAYLVLLSILNARAANNVSLSKLKIEQQCPCGYGNSQQIESWRISQNKHIYRYDPPNKDSLRKCSKQHRWFNVKVLSEFI